MSDNVPHPRCQRCGNNHSLSSSEWTLAGKICALRAERPDEWQMDEFLREAIRFDKMKVLVDDVLEWDFTSPGLIDNEHDGREFCKSLDRLEEFCNE